MPAPSLPPHPDPLLRCGDCAWALGPTGARRCEVAAIADDPGPLVGDDDGACRWFEPRFACDDCGACCREAFDSVPVTPEDRARLGPANAHLVRVHDDGWVDLHRVPSPAPPRDGDCTRCVALTGDGVASPFRCRIYDVRPTNCRELDVGSRACRTARQRVGMSPERLEGGP
jgi:Fe-S-cluster containining protein